MSLYPVRYEADYVEPQGRARAFFRWLLILPWYLLGSVYSLVAYVVAMIAWFALLFTARYPQGLYEFNLGFLRFTGRAYAFAMLQTEEWPPFGFDEDSSYPVRVIADPPLERYNRWKVFFRLVLGIPVMFMVYLFSYLYLLAATIAWFHIVFMGRTSGGVHNALTTGLAYQVRTLAYFLLLTETLPPVSDQEPAGSERPLAPPKALGRGSAAKAPAKKRAAGKAPAERAAKAPAKKAAAGKKAAAKKPAGGGS